MKKQQEQRAKNTLGSAWNQSKKEPSLERTATVRIEYETLVNNDLEPKTSLKKMTKDSHL